MARTFLHSMFIDFDSFFASVEQVAKPRLRGRPVAVVPLLAETTCCIAASRQARAYSVKTGTPVYEARRLCPDLVVVEARPELYVRCHRRINEIIEGCGVSPQVASIDEVHCALWGEWMEVGAAQTLARRIKEAIAREVSPVLTCSVGLAPNRFLAKTASDMDKPDGLVTITPDDLPGCLHPLKLRDLCGIGARMEARLRARQIDTVEHLCAASRELLREVWGGAEGERFHAALHGLPTVARETTCRSVSHSHILPPDLRGEEGARSVLHRLTQKAATRLRSMRHVAGAMGVFVRATAGYRDWSDEVRFPDTQDTIDLLQALDRMWERRPAGVGAAPLGVGVNLFLLKEEKNSVLPLLERPQHARQAALLAVVDRLNLHKKHAVYFGGAHGSLAYTPMRIAFNRIPDPETER